MNAFRATDEDDEDWDDAEAESGEDQDADATVPCPSCRREILEDTPRCPYCEQYISAEDHAGAAKPAWVILTALVCLGIAIWWVLVAV